MTAHPHSRYRVPGRPLNLTDRFLLENLRAGRGGKVALIVDHPERGVAHYTYQEVAEAAAQYGHELRARGLGLEDRVFIVLEDGLEWVAAFFGALQLGCTVMFLNPKVSAEELAFYLDDSRCRGVVTTKEVAAQLPLHRPHLRTVLAVDDEAALAALDARPTVLDVAHTLEEDFAIWLYSSGSTGAPKAAVHRAYDFVYNTERYAQHVLQMTEADVTVSVPKLFFGYATGSNLLFPFFFGGTAVLFPDRPTPERMFGLVARHKATILVNVPTLIAQMAERWEADAARPDVSSLRLLTSAGEALPEELYKRWMAGPGVEILDGIGSAEMFHVFISATLGQVRPGSLGTLVDGYQVRIADANGADVPEGEVGTLWVGGGSAAAFYWNRHERSRETLRGSWVVTSDLFRRDADGYYWYQGRSDDVLKVAGRWVTPNEIEAALCQHEAVAEAGAAAYEEAGLTKPMAFVILRGGAERSEALAKALSTHVAETLAPYKAPRFVEFVETLPRGDRDKLDRKALAAQARESAARRGLKG
jgi:benzoate-CoA ligase family protein